MRPPRAQVLSGLRQWLEALIRNMQILRAEEEAAREVEAEIWRNIRQTKYIIKPRPTPIMDIEAIISLRPMFLKWLVV
ncbi:hypothetical protein PENFLA_c044G02272 [Penicillium flavigenum]|uniref:Uncharacterized protein n=1 Tax=Penicillium flavigenum TaxID=254877 RepID=A0A1V6SI88_9EURO|nr:hypothetical protein PENFLA_c044G02272 [Penicillium flavigenum]